MQQISSSSAGYSVNSSVGTKINTSIFLASVLLAVSALLLAPVVSAAPIKVAFIADQGVDEDAQAVLSLIANEGTDLLLIQGDLGYGDGTADQWEANLKNALGHNFPVVTVVGNHENHEWPRYKQFIQSRISRAGSRGLSCAGDLGVKGVCRFGNIEMVHVSPGINEVAGVNPNDNYEGFIRSAFSRPSGNWRICSVHKNQKNLQVGEKGNSTGYEIYNGCLDAGAIVVAGHSHTYSRTHLLSSFENQTVVHRNSEMTIRPGQSIVAVSGLGGKSIRAQKRGGDWWGSIYTSSQGATHGALFCSFDSRTADCYFKAIDGSVPDRFSLRLGAGGSTGTVAPPAPQAEPDPEPVAAQQPTEDPTTSASLPNGRGYVFARTDSDEIRWIDSDGAGGIGSTWIDQQCAEQLGGVSAKGDWDELLERAPNIDSIAYPCDGSSTASQTPPSNSQSSKPTSSAAGYVFSRTDKDEYRWVDLDGSGGVGNIWIDRACAERLGGPSASGDWGDLVSVSPNMDSIASPCDGGSGGGSSSVDTVAKGSGYVFSRTDKEEYRWINLDKASGRLGSIWIDAECADSMGGATASGDWGDLNAQAPALDTIEYPCI